MVDFKRLKFLENFMNRFSVFLYLFVSSAQLQAGKSLSDGPTACGILFLARCVNAGECFISEDRVTPTFVNYFVDLREKLKAKFTNNGVMTLPGAGFERVLFYRTLEIADKLFIKDKNWPKSERNRMGVMGQGSTQTNFDRIKAPDLYQALFGSIPVRSEIDAGFSAVDFITKHFYESVLKPKLSYLRKQVPDAPYQKSGLIDALKSLNILHRWYVEILDTLYNLHAGTRVPDENLYEVSRLLGSKHMDEQLKKIFQIIAKYGRDFSNPTLQQDFVEFLVARSKFINSISKPSLLNLDYNPKARESQTPDGVKYTWFSYLLPKNHPEYDLYEQNHPHLYALEAVRDATKIPIWSRFLSNIEKVSMDYLTRSYSEKFSALDLLAEFAVRKIPVIDNGKATHILIMPPSSDPLDINFDERVELLAIMLKDYYKTNPNVKVFTAELNKGFDQPTHTMSRSEVEYKAKMHYEKNLLFPKEFEGSLNNDDSVIIFDDSIRTGVALDAAAKMVGKLNHSVSVRGFVITRVPEIGEIIKDD